jgi:hypothetical protein
MKLTERLAREKYPYGKAAFDIIPCINPWGWAHHIRFNRDGKDINRDFASFKSQEAAIIRNFVSGRTYDLIIDHHEDPRASGFYIYQYDSPNTTVSRGIIRAMRAQGYPVEQNVKMVVLKTKDGLIDAPRWGLWYMKITRQLSITNYLRLYNSTRVYTIETPTSLKWVDRLRMHLRAQDMLIRHLVESAK